MRDTLQTQILFFVILFSAIGAFGPWGLPIGGVILAVVAFLRWPMSLWRKVLIGGGVLALLLLLTASHRTQSRRVPARHSPCRSRLKQIGVALHKYESAHRRFPPASYNYRKSLDSAPLPLSWRVLLLPSLENQDLYDQYDPGEPWDGPNNRNVANRSILEYRCGSRTESSKMADFAMITGPGTAGSLSLSDTTDGTGNTAIVVEIGNSDIAWTEPRDIPIDELADYLDPKAKNSIVTVHKYNDGFFRRKEPHFIHVLLVDGSCHALPSTIPAEKLRALFTANGGEDLSFQDLDEYEWIVIKHVRWNRIVGVLVLVVSMAVLLFRRRQKPDAADSSE